MLRREFIILGGGVAVFPRAARAQLAIPVIGFLGSALQSVSNYLAAFRNPIRTLPSLLEGTPCTPLRLSYRDGRLHPVRRQRLCPEPRGIVLHKPSAIADELWHLNGPGRSAWSFYQNWAVRRKVVSRTHRCSAGEEFVNVRLAAYVQEITG